MLSILMNWLIVTLILLAIGTFLPGVTIKSFSVALLVVFIFGLLNILVKPVLLLLTLPLNLLTLGLFTFILNAFLFALGAYLVPGFEVSGFIPALLGSLLLSVGSALSQQLLHPILH